MRYILLLLSLASLLLLPGCMLSQQLLYSNVQQLTLEQHRYVSPRWSPDGTKIGYVVALTPSEYVLHIMDSDGKNDRVIAKNIYTFDWSPNGQKIVFASTTDTPPHLYTMNLDGTNVVPITRISQETDAPKWSPDGKHIAFTSALTNNLEDFQLYVMNLDNGSQVQVTKPPLHEVFKYEWFPDSNGLTFVANDEHNDEHLYVINVNGSGLVEINPGQSGSFYPAGVFAGKQVIYRADMSNLLINGLYVANVDGTDTHMIYLGDGDQPHWSPVRNGLVCVIGGKMYDGQIYKLSGLQFR